MILYGIPNCSSVKKARLWLDAHQINYIFHDYKKQGVPDAIQAWVAEHGWMAVCNRKGTTWRSLDPAAQASVCDAASAIEQMRSHASLIKRPILALDAQHSLLGFDEVAYSAQLGI